MSALVEIAFENVKSPLSEFQKDLILLSEVEKREFAHFSTHKRKFEWLAGRMACKQAVTKVLKKLASTGVSTPLRFFDLPLNSFVVHPSSGRPPALSLPQGSPSMAVSISHSSGLAAAIASPKEPGNIRLGLDIEKSGPIDPDLFEIAFTKKELVWIWLENWRLFQFWTAKEALLKALGLGLTVDLQDVRVIEPLGSSHLVLVFRELRYEIHCFQRGLFYGAWLKISENPSRRVENLL